MSYFKKPTSRLSRHKLLVAALIVGVLAQLVAAGVVGHPGILFSIDAPRAALGFVLAFSLLLLAWILRTRSSLLALPLAALALWGGALPSIDPARYASQVNPAPYLSFNPVFMTDVVSHAYNRGTPAAFSRIREGVRVGEISIIESHQYTHEIGELGLRLYPDLSAGFAQCESADFTDGCKHGLVTRFIATRATPASPGLVSWACDFVISPPQCAHGVGHAVQPMLDYDIKKILQYCDELRKDLSQSCYIGAYGIYESAQDAKLPAYLNPADPTFPCRILEEKYLATCWHSQAGALRWMNNNDWPRTAAQCAELAPKEYVVDCYLGLGRELEGVHRNLSLPELVQMCRSLSTEAQGYCLSALVVESRRPETVTEFPSFCAAIEQEAGRLRCFGSYGQRLAEESPAQQVAYCQELSNPLEKQSCLYGSASR